MLPDIGPQGELQILHQRDEFAPAAQGEPESLLCFGKEGTVPGVGALIEAKCFGQLFPH